MYRNAVFLPSPPPPPPKKKFKPDTLGLDYELSLFRLVLCARRERNGRVNSWGREAWDQGFTRGCEFSNSRERHHTKGLMSRPMAEHERYKSLNISLPSSAQKQLEMTKFVLFWKTRTTAANFSYFHLKFNSDVTHNLCQFRDQ